MAEAVHLSAVDEKRVCMDWIFQALGGAGQRIDLYWCRSDVLFEVLQDFGPGDHCLMKMRATFLWFLNAEFLLRHVACLLLFI